ncbi:cytochrome c biogenesis protein CcdA [Candidatus Berkelbacteria bacterium]|nr:cytochrome c biogenesis protein CcdA [Candidatus Berkelbacteria bacterium]
MTEVLTLAIPTFIAGVLTFLAPCTLPLVPAYLGFISGVPAEELTRSNREIRRRIINNGLLFVAGFTLVFVIFGVLAGLFGIALAPYRIWLTRLGGLFIILFGLTMLGILKLPFLTREVKFQLPSVFQRGKPTTSFALGFAFGFGWTPCVGPILASVLLLTTSTTTALQGGILLAVFSLGLAVPFLLTALGFGTAFRPGGWIARHLHWIERVGGVFLIALGVLVYTNRIPLLISWGYQLLQFINYDRLVNYL